MPNLEPTSKQIMKVLQDSKIVAYRNKKLNIEKFSKDLHKVKSKKKIQAKNLAKISQYETDEPTKRTIDRRFQRKTVSHDDFGKLIFWFYYCNKNVYLEFNINRT